MIQDSSSQGKKLQQVLHFFLSITFSIVLKHLNIVMPNQRQTVGDRIF